VILQHARSDAVPRTADLSRCHGFPKTRPMASAVGRPILEYRCTKHSSAIYPLTSGIVRWSVVERHLAKSPNMSALVGLLLGFLWLVKEF
jgi:hypothetical protein